MAASSLQCTTAWLQGFKIAKEWTQPPYTEEKSSSWMPQFGEACSDTARDLDMNLLAPILEARVEIHTGSPG